MAPQKTDSKPTPTIWKIPDGIWPIIQTMLDEQYPAEPKGDRRVKLRRVLNGILAPSLPG